MSVNKQPSRGHQINAENEDDLSDSTLLFRGCVIDDGEGIMQVTYKKAFSSLFLDIRKTNLM